MKPLSHPDLPSTTKFSSPVCFMSLTHIVVSEIFNYVSLRETPFVGYPFLRMAEFILVHLVQCLC